MSIHVQRIVSSGGGGEKSGILHDLGSLNILNVYCIFHVYSSTTVIMVFIIIWFFYIYDCWNGICDGFVTLGLCPNGAQTKMVWTLFCIFFYLSIGAGVEPSPLLLRPFIGLLYQPWMIDGDDCGAISVINEWQGKPKYCEETCPSAALSTTDPTRLDSGSNPGLHGGKPMIGPMTYGTALKWCNLQESLSPSIVRCGSHENTTRFRRFLSVLW
jgi:hypothetical protein